MTPCDPSDRFRFVVQEHHTTDGVHWDLMLEQGQTLWTWRIDRPPAEIGNTPLPAVRIADHALRFLSYEGPVQNQTGHVSIADRGFFHILEQTPDTFCIMLDGLYLKGRMTLRQKDAEWVLTAG